MRKGRDQDPDSPELPRLVWMPGRQILLRPYPGIIMPPENKPVYQARGEVYQIDSQEPQHRAVQTGRAQMFALSGGSYIGSRLPEGALPGLSSAGWMNIVGTQDWGMEPHRNEGIEITLIEAGETPFIVDGVRHELHGGDMTVTQPWQLHQVGDPFIGSVRLMWLILDVGVRRPNQPWKLPGWVQLTQPDRDEFVARLRSNDHPVRRSTPALRQSYSRLYATLKRPAARRDLSRLTICVNGLLLDLLDLLRGEEKNRDAYLTSNERSIELFLNQLRNDRSTITNAWTLESMAAACNVGTTSLIKYCRLLTNMSPMSYLGRCRAEMAARMLHEQPGRPVTDVAFACGFSSSQYFAFVFKRRFGCSPSDFRCRLPTNIVRAWA